MVREINPRQRLSKIVNDSIGLVETVKRVDNICRYCRPASPMFCVERCEVWRTKREFLELNGTLCADDYMPNLLNALKNDRRQEVIEALSERPRSLKEIQEHLKGKDHHHSRSTIASTYVEPLVNVGLVQEKDSKYRLTLYGRRFKDMLSNFNVEDSLPPHSRCYEENVLRKLKDGPKNHSDLAEFVPENSLSRTLQRLKERGLVRKSESPCYVFYFRTKKVPKRKFSPTEKRVYEAIPEIGVSAPELSEKGGINLRRTYKYLRRLRRRRLVFTRKRPGTYELTPSGREVADFLEEAMDLALDASRASTLLHERCEQIMATPIV